MNYLKYDCVFFMWYSNNSENDKPLNKFWFGEAGLGLFDVYR